MGGRGPFREPKGVGDWAHLVRVIQKMFPQLAGVPIAFRWCGRIAAFCTVIRMRSSRIESASGPVACGMRQEPWMMRRLLGSAGGNEKLGKT